MKKNKKGITLVALVITIVILLILAGISISALTNTGLFGKAKEAKEKSENAEKEQSQTLSEYEKELNKYVAKELTDDKINKVLSKTENTVLKDANGNVFTLPAGFKVVVSDDTNNAKTVDKGIVIEDETDAATKGSQFVWVPVGNIYIDTERTEANAKTVELNRYTFKDDENGTPTAYGKDEIDSKYSEIESKSLIDFKNSVITNGGYYIGRFEARKNSTSNKLTLVKTDGVWKNISQPNSLELCRNMYSNDKFASDLVNSYAWDTAIVFIQKITNKSYAYQKSLNKGIASNVGTEIDKKCNIYDMASNLLEWSTETSNVTNKPCTVRGGNSSDSRDFTCDRDFYTNSASSVGIGFRPIIYI